MNWPDQAGSEECPAELRQLLPQRPARPGQPADPDLLALDNSETLFERRRSLVERAETPGAAAFTLC